MSRFKLHTKHGIILCHAEIQNRVKSLYIKMALDTGATYTMIPFEAVAAIGIDPTKAKKNIEIIMGSGIIIAPIITIPSFRAFGYQIKNLEVACHNLPPESSVEGLLGLNFLKYFNILLNFKSDIIEINP